MKWCLVFLMLRSCVSELVMCVCANVCAFVCVCVGGWVPVCVGLSERLDSTRIRYDMLTS